MRLRILKFLHKAGELIVSKGFTFDFPRTRLYGQVIWRNRRISALWIWMITAYSFSFLFFYFRVAYNCAAEKKRKKCTKLVDFFFVRFASSFLSRHQNIFVYLVVRRKADRFVICELASSLCNMISSASNYRRLWGEENAHGEKFFQHKEPSVKLRETSHASGDSLLLAVLMMTHTY